MNFNESQTKVNLAKSFAAECQAGARYQFMATQAQLENFVFVKDTMKMIAKNEMAHAKLFYDYIVDKSGECKVMLEADYPYVDPALENSLLSERKIEEEEADSLYPDFAKVARDEGFFDVAESFELVAKVEATHAEILGYIYDGYKKNNLYKSKNKIAYRCSNCGHIECRTEGWKKCPLCSLDMGYIAIDFGEIFESAACC